VNLIEIGHDGANEFEEQGFREKTIEGGGPRRLRESRITLKNLTSPNGLQSPWHVPRAEIGR
jgi:hypothetical protein